MSFVHLHVHSHYSLLDGLPKIPDLVEFAKARGMQALALTDHGVMYGVIEFYKAARRSGLQPIIGVEAYVARDSLHAKSGRVDADYYHLVLLARDLEGYKNLVELVTISHLDGYYYKPRIDKNLLAQKAKGLIGLSGCLRGEVSQTLETQNFELAKKAANDYRQIFEKDCFYLELQRNMPGTRQEQVNQGLVKLGAELGLPLVATNDAHYLEPDDAEAQDILVCVGTGKTVASTDRLDMRGLRLDLKSPQEMAKSFADLPEALENSNRIAEAISLELPLGQRHFPSFQTSRNLGSSELLRELSQAGLEAHYHGQIPPEIKKRLEYELEVINTKGYASYFLVVADVVNWARKRGIITTTRGSAAGSLVAYALGITTINPIEYKLPFERFLNLERPLPPDIDLDIADNRRDEVLQYVSEKYGKDRMAQIVTFGTMMARAAVRDVGRALAIPYSKCDRLAKMIPFGRQGFHMSMARALEVSPDLKAAYQTDPEAKKIIDLAQKVEGCARHASVHAAGVVIGPTNLTQYTPLQLDVDNKNIITQYDMYSVEDAGLVKMDFLGIRNLSILGNAVEVVRVTRAIEVDLQNIPLNDRKTFDLLSGGKTMGVFQLGGSGMTRYLVELKPTNIFDIMAMISLYRPGPMESIPEFIARKHNPKQITYLDPRLKEILDMSYGVITYQDDVLLIAIKLAGYSWEEADKLRKAMGKKIPKEMIAQKEKFIQGALDNGLSSDKAVKLWGLIEPFAAYGFNKAHAASYAIVAYQTAYMKANFPVEFMAAVMSAESSDLEKIAEAVAEAEALGIEVLPPDVNESLANFTVINDRQIRFGLAAIKNLGTDVINEIILERKQNGPFLSLSDFLRRIKTRNFNKKSWEALAKSGSLDRFGERNQMLASTDSVLDYARFQQKRAAAGQVMLFAGNGEQGDDLVLKKVAPATEQEKLSWEKELLGLYVSSHPLANHRGTIQRYCTAINNINHEHDNSYFTVGGIITRVQNILTKRGEQMCFADLEDLDGKLELVVFPNAFQQYRELLMVDQMVLVRGRVSDKDGEIKLLADSLKSIQDEDLEEWASSQVSPPSTSPSTSSGSAQGRKNLVPEPVEGRSKLLKIKIPSTASPQVFSKLKDVFNKYPGPTQVSLVIPDREGTPREVKTNFMVDGSEEFKVKLRELLKESIKQ